MIKRTLIFLTFFFLFWDTKAQESIQIDTISYPYYNLISNSHQTIELYKITNYSSEEYLTWIADVPINNSPEHRLVHDYFKKPKGDFKYINWMYEEDFGRPVSNWSIGVSFVKMIKPQDSFSYIIIKDSDDSNTYKDRIVIMSREKVEHYIGGGLYFVLKENLFFPYSSISLYDKPTRKDSSERDSSSQITDTSNRLNQFILESVCHFVKEHNAFAKQINSDTIRYICNDGLSVDFPFDSLYLKPLFISSIENNPKTTKKTLKRFVETMRVSYSLENNVIDIVISKYRIRRPRKGRAQIEVDGESASHYYYEYSCETSNWERVIKCVYSDVITQSFVCLQNDSISVYFKSPNLDKPSSFFGTYRYSNDTLRLSDNLLNDGMKPDDYLFVLDSTRRTLSIMPSPSTIKDTTSNDPSDPKAMLLGRRFKNTSCFEELKRVL